MIVASNLLYGQAFIDEVFNKYSGKPGFTSVMITPQLFKLLALVDKNDPELKMISEKMSSLKILVSEEKSVGFTNEVREKMSKSKYVNIMEVIDGTQKVNFYILQNDDIITDFLLLAIDDSEEVLLSITGNLKLSDLSKIGNNSSFGGGTGHLSLLKNLEGKN
jgi:hypothetical protein